MAIRLLSWARAADEHSQCFSLNKDVDNAIYDSKPWGSLALPRMYMYHASNLLKLHRLFWQ